jgi:hypothetical protein
MCLTRPVSRILSWTIIYLGSSLPKGSSGTPVTLESVAGTALHPSTYFAVSAGLNRIVSVRNAILADDGDYPLPFYPSA